MTRDTSHLTLLLGVVDGEGVEKVDDGWRRGVEGAGLLRPMLRETLVLLGIKAGGGIGNDKGRVGDGPFTLLLICSRTSGTFT